MFTGLFSRWLGCAEAFSLWLWMLADGLVRKSDWRKPFLVDGESATGHSASPKAELRSLRLVSSAVVRRGVVLGLQ